MSPAAPAGGGSRPLTVGAVFGALGRLALTVAALALLLGVSQVAPWVETVEGRRVSSPPPSARPGTLPVASGFVSLEGFSAVMQKQAVTDCATAVRDLIQPGPDGWPPIVLDQGDGPGGARATWVTGVAPEVLAQLSLGEVSELPRFVMHVAVAEGCGGTCAGELSHQAWAPSGALPASPPGEPALLPQAPLTKRVAWFDSGHGVALTMDQTDDVSLALETMDALLLAEGWLRVPIAAGGSWGTSEVAATYARAGAVLLLVPYGDSDGNFLLTIRQASGA